MKYINEFTKITLLLLISLLPISNLYSQKLEKLWEVSTLEAPESVVLDKEKEVYLVSNVSGQPAEKNGLGFISKIDKKGTIIEKKWVTGLNGPKGMAIYKRKLYVADIDVIKVVNLSNGNIIKTYKAEGATFLNDVEISKDGTVYVTDTFGGNAIYRIKDDEISIWLKSDKLDYPNGIKINNNKIFVATWGVVTNQETFGTDIPGKLLSINLESKEIKQISSSIGNLDGLVNYSNRFLVTDWISGKLLSVSKNGKTTTIKDLQPGSADLYLANQYNLLLIPQMLDGKLIAYKIN